MAYPGFSCGKVAAELLEGERDGKIAMVRLIRAARARRILGRYSGWIEAVSARYGVPSALIRAILFQEMTTMDLLDPLADLAVRCGVPWKKDSSTGYAQIFGYVGLNAVNFAVERGLATYGSLGITTDHRLDRDNHNDVRAIWKLLNRDPRANIEIAAINMLVAAEEMVGSTDFDSFTDEELKLVMTRYNAGVKHVTPYGEQVFRYYGHV